MNVVYTDGSSVGQRGPGGYAWVTADGRYLARYVPDTTINRMELMAVWSAVRTFPGPLQIFSDSLYVVDTINKNYHKSWDLAVAPNGDLWTGMLHDFHPGLVLQHVRGHSGNVGNDAADYWAKRARRTETSYYRTHAPIRL